MKDKKKIITSGIGIFLLLVLVIGASYAFFLAQINSGASTDVTVEADTVDSLQFATGGAINLRITQDNFASGGSNKKGNTTATATLIAGTNRNPSYTYNVYLSINVNELTYTTEEKKPELILRVTNPSNTAITTLEGLTYNSTLSGFDITETDGLITLASNYTITTTSTLRQNWKVEIELINLDTNQKELAGKSFAAEVIIQKDKIALPFANYIKSLYTSQGANNLYHHNGKITDTEGNIVDAEDGSYRYSGSSDATNNFVCFGSDVTTCPNDNLYRIIGVFGDKVKLIKHGYANSNMLGTDGDYYNIANSFHWNYNGLSDHTGDNQNGSNDWETSLLNKTNLNTNYINYLNNIDTKWVDMIADTKWNIGGYTTNLAPAKTFYDAEKVKQTSEATKIGLMQVSDYGYATVPSNWRTNLSSYYLLTDDNNWILMGENEWTITPNLGNSSSAFYVNDNGRLSGMASNGYNAVRPVFYLNSSVPYISGEGTSSNPYRIS